MRFAGTVLLIALAGAACLAFPRAAPAQGAFVLLNERNHPELLWQSLRTEHFEIHYHDPLLPWAREAAAILERYHDPLCRRLSVRPERRTRVYLSDQDQIANGAALAWDYFFVWIPGHAFHNVLSGGRSAFEELLIHEYTHILISEAARTWLGTLAFPLGMYPPRWLHEGVAQWTVEPWSVLRGDQLLASALLDGSIDSSPPGVPGHERLIYYARGHARVRWLASSYGDSTIGKLLEPRGSWGTYSYRAAERAALGKESSGSDDRFRRAMIAFYGARYQGAESPDSIGRALDLKMSYPWRVLGAGDSFLVAGQVRRGYPESSLLRAREGKGPRRLVAGGVTGAPVPIDGRRILVPRTHRVAHGSWVTDLALYEEGRGTRFLTSGARLVEVARIAGERIAALADSSAGPALLVGELPAQGKALEWRTRARWPRAWLVHGLAVSPDGSRAIVAAADTLGARGLWGLDVEQDAPPVRLTHDRAEARGGIWLDDERIAWTSFAGGIAHVKSARWPRAAASLEDESLRTATGVGSELAGRTGDSLLVLDRTSRRETRVLSADPTRVPARPLPHPAYPFDATPEVDPRDPAPLSIDGPTAYRAWREVRPWLRLPLLGPQAREPAIGAAGLWAEPLLRHAWGGFLYTSAEQMPHPDRALFYLTGRFGPWVLLHHSSVLLPRRILDGRGLIERVEQTGISVLAPFHVESDPNVRAWLNGSVRTESHRPRFSGRRMSTPLGAPTAWSALLVGVGGGWLRSSATASTGADRRIGQGAAARIEGAIDPWPAGERFLRGSFGLFRAQPLPGPTGTTLWIEAAGRATSLPVPPQEFEGLDADPTLRVGENPLFSGTVFLRGWPEARAARGVLHGNLELRLPVLPDLGFRGPGTRIGGGTLAGFLEMGHPWGGPSAAFFEERTRAAAGVEARLSARVGPLNLVPAVAWGHPLGSHGPRGSWTVRLAGRLPFAAPRQPAQLFRCLLPGAVHDLEEPGRGNPCSHWEQPVGW
jgi:hypothetical protein